MDKRVAENSHARSPDGPGPPLQRCARMIDTPEPTVASSGRLFPIHSIDRSYMTGINWDIVAPHESQAIKNHDQSLEALAYRGGLSLCELAAVLEDRPWRKMDTMEALAAVKKVCNV